MKVREDAVQFMRNVFESHRKEFEAATKDWEKKVNHVKEKRLFERRKERGMYI